MPWEISYLPAKNPYERYSHDEAKAFTNIKTKVAYGCDDASDAEFISKMLGTRTKKIVTRSVSNQAQGGINDSKNSSYQAIPLLRPDEVMRLKPHIALIIRTGASPVKARQFIWYKEKSMKHCPQPPSFVPKQLIEQHPFIRPDKPLDLIGAVKKKKKREASGVFEWRDG